MDSLKVRHDKALESNDFKALEKLLAEMIELEGDFREELLGYVLQYSPSST